MGVDPTISRNVEYRSIPELAIKFLVLLKAMPDISQEHLSAAEEKIRHFLDLAEEILSLREAMLRRLDETLTSRSITESLRNRVLIGLNLKALDCFDRLIIDARDRRGEASHHLKTMAECFIYSHWVSHDNGETRASLLFAEGYRSRVAYHESLEETELATAWRELQHQQSQGFQLEWLEFKNSSLEKLASDANVEPTYQMIYRFACEAAHVGDLFAYTPPQPKEVGLRLSDFSLLRAYVSLKFGIILACDLLHDASDTLGMGADEQIDGLRERWRAIIAFGSSPSDK